MKIKFVEAAAVYPDGNLPVDMAIGEIREDFSDDYARLMIEKGHAVEEKAASGKSKPTPAAPEEPLAS